MTLRETMARLILRETGGFEYEGTSLVDAALSNPRATEAVRIADAVLAAIASDKATPPADRRDQGLKVEIANDRLEITIGVDALAVAARGGDYWDDELYRITDVDAAAQSICLGLEREEEDGTTSVHVAIDAAVEWAIEYGENGFAVAGDEDGDDPEDDQ